MERFSITRVSNKDAHKDLNKIRHELALNVGDLNIRRNSRTVPNLGEARKFSLAQLTRWTDESKLLFLFAFFIHDE